MICVNHIDEDEFFKKTSPTVA